MGIPRFILAGPSERQQFLTHRFNDNSIRFVLNYPGMIDPDALRASVKKVIESVDILHGSFFTDHVSAYWRLNEEIDEINYFHYVYCGGDPAETAYDLSLFPVFAEDKVQLRVWLVQSNTASSLVVVISHLAVDGSDGKYLLNKIIEGYNMYLAAGSVSELEVKNGSRAPEKLYANINPKELKNLFGSPVPSVKTLYPYPTEEAGRVRQLRKVIPADVMTAARRKAKTIGASANDLLVAALNQAYADLPGVDRAQPISVTSMMDLRKHCKNGESEGLCNMSGTMPTLLKNGAFDTFGETLAEIAAQTGAMKEDPYAGLSGMPLIHAATRTVPVGLMLLMAGKIYEKISLGVTNLGNVRCADYALGGIVPNGGFFGGPVKKKPGMQVAVMSFDGECVLAVCGQLTDTDAAMLWSTLDAMAGYIEKYANE